MAVHFKLQISAFLELLYHHHALLQEWFPTALKQLMEGTQASEPKFLDQRLHKQRKLAAGTKSSRTWFVKGTDWLAGTTADAQAAPAFFDEPEQVFGIPMATTVHMAFMLACKIVSPKDLLAHLQSTNLRERGIAMSSEPMNNCQRGMLADHPRVYRVIWQSIIELLDRLYPDD